MRGIDVCMLRRRHQVGKQDHFAARQRAIGDRDFGFGWNVRQRIGEFCGVVRKYQPRRQELHHIAELAVIL